MKTNRFNHLIAVALGLTVFATTGCAEKAKTADTTLPSAKTVAANAESSTTPAPSPDIAAPRWINLKDITYDMREQFFVGLKQMESVVDGQISALTAKRAAMTSTANTKDWDFAMKEMVNARSYLKSTGEVLGKATPETWTQEKDRVGQAWVRTQEAYAKVTGSTTS